MTVEEFETTNVKHNIVWATIVTEYMLVAADIIIIPIIGITIIIIAIIIIIITAITISFTITTNIIIAFF
jgi:hypothetical protein